MLAAISFSEIERPTVAQLRAKRAALLAVAAPTLFTFIGVVLYMLRNPVPDTWFWVACWAIVPLLLLRFDNDAPAKLAARLAPPPLRVAHGVPALALVMIFLVLHISNHLMFPAGSATYDAVMKVFRHVYRTEILQPLVALFLFQVGTEFFFVWRLTAAALPHLPDRVGRLPRVLRAGSHGLGLHFRTDISRHRHRVGLRHRTPERRPASSRTRGTSASCRTIGSACSLSSRILRPARV